jgi:hypothetical protein
MEMYMGYMSTAVYRLMQTWHIYGSVWLNIGTAWNSSIEVPNVELGVRNGLWDTWEIPFTAKPKLAFIWDQYDWKSEVHVEVSDIEFQHKVWRGLWDTWKSQFM